MSTLATYYQLPVLLVKTTRKSRNHKNLNFDPKFGALQVGKKNQIIMYYLSVNYIKWFQPKQIRYFFLILGFISSPPNQRYIHFKGRRHGAIRVVQNWTIPSPITIVQIKPICFKIEEFLVFNLSLDAFMYHPQFSNGQWLFINDCSILFIILLVSVLTCIYWYHTFIPYSGIMYFDLYFWKYSWLSHNFILDSAILNYNF